MLIFSQSRANSLEIPSFLPQYFTSVFQNKWTKSQICNHSEKDGMEQYLYFIDDKSLVLLVENIKCDRPRQSAIFKNIIGNLNDRMKSQKGEFL